MLFMGETEALVLDPGRGGENAETYPIAFDSILLIDCDTSSNWLTKPIRKGTAPVRYAHCWAHAQSELKEFFYRDGSEIASERLRRKISTKS